MSSGRVNPSARQAPLRGPSFLRVIGALSRALDMAEGYPVGHAVRTAVIGVTLARTLGLRDDERKELVCALLVKDLGGSLNAARLYELAGTDDHEFKRHLRLTDWRSLRERMAHGFAYVGRGEPWLARISRLAHLTASARVVTRRLFEARVDGGAALALNLGLSPAAADAIRGADEHWDGGGQPDGARGPQIPLGSRIVGLAQMLEILSFEFDHYRALAIARDRSGRWFDPALVAAALSLENQTAFWEKLRTAEPTALLHELESEHDARLADERTLDRVAESFASVIDSKSAYTRERSRRVADCAAAIGRRLGFDRVALDRTRRAALLRDIGTLAIPNRILDKPDRLTAGEWTMLREHPKKTRSILETAPVFDELAFDASCHHEKLNGQGYPGGLPADRLSPTARVIAVADIADALSARRPYRPSLDRAEVCRILDDERRTGALCPDSVAIAMDVLAESAD